MLNVSLDLKHDVNLFGFLFGKMKILQWPLSQKWDLSLYDYKFDKREGWTSLINWNVPEECAEFFTKMMRDSTPVPENLPLSYYEAKRLVSKLGLEEKKGM